MGVVVAGEVADQHGGAVSDPECAGLEGAGAGGLGVLVHGVDASGDLLDRPGPGHGRVVVQRAVAASSPRPVSQLWWIWTGSWPAGALWIGSGTGSGLAGCSGSTGSNDSYRRLIAYGTGHGLDLS